ASSQPSLKNDQIGRGRQVSGSGVPKIDSVIVPKIPCTTRGAVGAAPGTGLYTGWGTVIAPAFDSGVDSSESSASERIWPGVPVVGTGGDGFCAWACPANVSNETTSAAATRPTSE